VAVPGAVGLFVG